MCTALRAISLICLCSLVGVSYVSGQTEWPVNTAEQITILVTYHSLTGSTEKMAHAVVEGVQSVPGTQVTLKRVANVTAEQLFGSDAVIVGSPVYWSNMAGEVKTFFDNWQFKFGVFPEFKMQNKVGAGFCDRRTSFERKRGNHADHFGCDVREHKMIVVSEGGAFGASATTEGRSPGD